MLHVALDLWRLDRFPDAREKLIEAVLKLAPKSPLYAAPGMKAAVEALAKAYEGCQQTGATIGVLRKQLAFLEQVWAEERHATGMCLVAVKQLTEVNAKTEADVASMAFEAMLRKSAPSDLPPVESIDVRTGPKGSGRAYASAHETGPTKWHYAAQSSPGPMDPSTWSDLIGDGKQRKLHGRSGSSIWVRFARKRGDQQSEWCTPVLITFP